MLSPKSKRNILRIIPFGLIWLIFSFVYTVVEKGLLGDLSYYPSTGNPYNSGWNFFITPLSAFITGIFIGTVEILYFNKIFSKRTFTQKIIFKLLTYLALIVCFLTMLSAFGNALEMNASVFDKVVWEKIAAFIPTYSFVSIEVYISSVILVSQFYTEVSDNIGQDVLVNFFTGKYHQPIEEERIFMFLDMKSSTSIAERLGHVKYFEMLREYYADLSDAVIDHGGEIYQYVGDEVVVSWKLESGVRDQNCVRCFFAMRKSLADQREKYHTRFGVLPEFKAGLHSGKVTTGEIGVIKKDIIFTGDVLNACSRIQGLCNTLQVDILVSERLIKKLTLNNHFQVKSLGVNELKGREGKVELFTLTFMI